MLAATSFAEWTPVMVSLVTPVQVPLRNYDVTGFRLSLLYGDCHDFTGLDIGVAQRTADDFAGLGIGGVNIAGGQLYGGQVGLVNWNSNGKTPWEERSIGAQIGVINSSAVFCGLQEGLINFSADLFTGIQSGLFNRSGSLTGWQCGLINTSDNLFGLQCGPLIVFGVNTASVVNGCQIGLVNYANTMENGVQIGLVNIIARNGWAPVLPLVNGGF